MKPPRPTKQLPTDLRSLTPIEHRYVQSRLRDQRLGRWITLVCAVGVMSAMVLLIQLFLGEGIALDSIMVLVVGTLSIILCGAMVRVLWQRRFAVDEHVSLLRGTLTAYSTRVNNPQTGGSSSTRTYYIGELRLILPFETEEVCRRAANRQVDAFVVYLHKSNPLNWGQPGELMHEGPTEAIVLDLADQLHVHGLLSTYGENYLLRRKLRWTVITLAMLLFLCGGMLGLLSLPVEASVTVVIVGVLALGIASFFFLMGMCWACDAAERRWAPLIDTRDHSERLSKTAEGSRAHLMRHRKRAST